jgi:hypothetical protein
MRTNSDLLLKSPRRAWSAPLTIVLAALMSPASAAPGWSPNSLVKDIQFGPSTVYVQLDPATVGNQNACTYAGGWYIIYNGTVSLNFFEQAKITAALAARTSGKLVKIYSGNCNTLASYNEITYIQIIQD